MASGKVSALSGFKDVQMHPLVVFVVSGLVRTQGVRLSRVAFTTASASSASAWIQASDSAAALLAEACPPTFDLAAPGRSRALIAC